MNSSTKTYLGDSVYVEFDGFGLILTTENGYGSSNQIFLDPGVFDALVEFHSRTQALRNQISSATPSSEATGEAPAMPQTDEEHRK